MPHQTKVLLVEDNAGDVHLLREAFSEVGFAPELEVVATGKAALAYLRAMNDRGEWSKPDVVLLDLNIPGLYGLEFLEILRRDAALKSTPVIVLSSSADERDIHGAHALCVEDYMIKPMDFDHLVEVADKIARHCARLNP